MFWAQAVVDPERPGLEVREHAVDPGQHHMRGHGADDPRVVVDPGGAGVGRATLAVVAGAMLVAMKPCRLVAEKSLIAARRMRPGPTT